MAELGIAVLALIFALAVVLIIHRQISGDIRIQSASSKAIMAMDAVAIAVLYAAFTLGEVGTFARTVQRGSTVPRMALTWHDIGLVLGTLLGSLLIYVAIERLRKTDR